MLDADHVPCIISGSLRDHLFAVVDGQRWHLSTELHGVPVLRIALAGIRVAGSPSSTTNQVHGLVCFEYAVLVERRLETP